MENPVQKYLDKHPDIKGWTLAHRAELIAAALTLIRAWFTDEERTESPAGRRFGSFEAWGGMMGGILDHAGVEGFLGSLVQWRSETDYETSFWSDHLRWLMGVFGEGGEFTVPEVVRKMRDARIGTVEHPPKLEDHTVTGYNRALGLAYGRMKNRTMNGLQLVKTADFAGHSSRWCVVDHRPDRPSADVVEVLSDTDGEQSATPDRVVRVDRNTATRGKISSTYTTRIGTTISSSATAVPTYPLYPNYPSTAGSDPLAHLFDQTVEVPARLCPDCDRPEEITPSGFWMACRTCNPETFTPRI